MSLLQYLRKFNTQSKIDKLAKKYKNKKIIVYGAGQFSRAIFENYDLSQLNIAGVCDKKFEQNEKTEFYDQNCIIPYDLRTLDYDVILIANFDYDLFANIIDELLYGTKNAGVEIRPLIGLTFFDIVFGNSDRHNFSYIFKGL